MQPAKQPDPVGVNEEISFPPSSRITVQQIVDCISQSGRVTSDKGPWNPYQNTEETLENASSIVHIEDFEFEFEASSRETTDQLGQILAQNPQPLQRVRLLSLIHI